MMFSEDRPRIKLKKNRLDYILEITACFLVILSFVLPAIYYSNLPDQIPMHFNLSGEVNRYDEKSMIWLIPVINLIIVAGMLQLNKYPHLYNYPEKITEENAEKYYTDSVKIIRWLCLIISIMMLVITYEIIQVALRNTKTFHPLSNYVLLGCIVLITGFPIVYLFKTFRKLKS